MELFSFCGATLAVFAGSIDDYEKYESNHNNALVTVLTHAALPAPVNLFREISGEDEVLPRLCSLSEKSKSTLVAGMIVRYGEVKRLSAAIAHRGVLEDVADSCTAPDPFVRGGTVKIFSTGGLSFAVCPGRDACSRLIIGKIVGLCDAVITLDPTYSPHAETSVRHLSTEFSLPVLYASPSRIFLSD